MKKLHLSPRIGVFIAALGLLAGDCVGQQPDLGPEPVYRGRNLSEWLAVYKTYWGWDFEHISPDTMWFDEGNIMMTFSPETFDRNSTAWDSELTNSANYAIWQIGTNSHPFLLRWMEDAEQPWLAEMRPQLNHLLWYLIGQMPLRKSPAAQRAEASAKAFLALGSRGEAAITNLALMLNDPHASAPALLAAEALTCMGKSGQPMLYAAITNQKNHPQVRISLIERFAKRITVQTWLQALQDQDLKVRIVATNTVCRHGPYMPGYPSELE